MRFQPANIRVINRRDSRLDHLRWCAPWHSVTDPAGCAGPLLRGGLLAGLDVDREMGEKIEQNKLA